MKILHTSDWHLGKKLDGYERIEEQKKFLSDLLNIVENNYIDIVIIAGDIYDSPNPPIEAEKLYYDFIKKIGELKKCNVIIISGNHDSPKRLLTTRNIQRDFGIIILTDTNEIVETGKYGIGNIKTSNRGCFEIEINNKESFISFIPYINDIEAESIIKNLIAEKEIICEKEISELSYAEKIKIIFKSREKNRNINLPYITISHLFANGIEGDKNEGDLEFGGAYTVKLSDLPQADYNALGHIHKPQKFLKYKTFYSGSPIEYRISENKFDKKIFIADIEKNSLAFDEINISNYKPIKKYLCESIENAIKISEEKNNVDEWIYLEINSERTLYTSEVKKIKENKNVVDIFLNLQGEMYKENEIINNNMEKNINLAFINYYKFINKNSEIEPKKEIIELFNKLVSEVE